MFQNNEKYLIEQSESNFAQSEFFQSNQQLSLTEEQLNTAKILEIEKELIHKERWLKYIEEARVYNIKIKKQIPKSRIVIKDQFQTIIHHFHPSLLDYQRYLKSSFEQESITFYLKYLLVPRIVIISLNASNPQEVSLQISLSNEGGDKTMYRLEWFEIKQYQPQFMSISIEDIQYLQMMARNRISISHKIKNKQQTDNLVVQFNSDRKQNKYYKCLNFLLEHKQYLLKIQ